MARHFVQIGVLGQIGRFSSLDCGVYRRGSEVVCRTDRGLEVGTVLAVDDAESDERKIESDESEKSLTNDNEDGKIIRALTNEDHLIVNRLGRNRMNAITACTNLLTKKKLPAILVDVEHIFDGQALYFYFLGEVGPELESLTSELAETYEAKVRFRKFSETLANGCGPDCGTKDCSTSGCSTCAAGGGCAAKSIKAKAGDAANV